MYIMEQIIILRMIYAYCLSLFSMHFFSTHSIANFKLRLINQQTGDCTDSVILHAGKLTPSTFPVPIKLKGGQRLLVKVKLLSLPSNNNEVLVGEGVVTFDKNCIDNTLRVPVYDKQRGVEEVAICSIDFFLSGFQVDKHNSMNADKSRSRFEDWRQRTQDAVYSQMSYTLESERQSQDSRNNSKINKPNLATAVTAPQKGTNNALEKQSKSKKVIFEQKRSQSKLNQSVKEIKMISPRNHHQEIDSEDEEESLVKKDLNKIQVEKPFTLENNVYLQQSPSKKLQLANKKSLKQTKRKPPSNLRKKFAIQSQQQFPRSDKDIALSPQNLRKTVKQNEQVLSQLKKYLFNMGKQQQSPKHKKRRNVIKIQQFSAYKSQNNYLKYHVQLKPSPKKVIKNLRAIRIIQNQIKQPSEQKVIAQIIDQIVLTSLSGIKLVTFDVNGFRSYCVSSGQSELVASIMVPTSQNAVKVRVRLKQQGEFQGVIGFQEGEAMTIILNRLNASEESILQKSDFKLLFDIKGTDSKPSPYNMINFHNNDVSFRQPYELIAPQDDIKTRVGQLGCQPWGFIKSYAEGVVLSPQSKQILEKIDQQLPPLKEEISRPKALTQPKRPKETISSIKRRESVLKKQEQTRQRSISSDYLQSPIKKVKPIPAHIRRQTESINSIRNGNRNNYRFQDRHSSKQIKQAWEQILFKRKLEEQQQQQAQKVKNRYILKTNNSQRSNSNQINQFSTDSQSQSISTFKPKKINKVYEFIPSQRKPKFPLRTFTLRISNVSITQPQALVDSRSDLNVGKFVKFSIKGSAIYFTEVIFSGNYNSILWKLQGCIFEQLTGNEKLMIEIYQTLNNRITLIGISFIRVNRLHFLRNNHIYNGTISHQNNLSGEFTLGFEVEENRPFEIIQEQDQDTINLVNKPNENSRTKLKTLSLQSQKNIKQIQSKQALKMKKTEISDDSEDQIYKSNEVQQSMSMPMGISQE